MSNTKIGSKGRTARPVARAEAVGSLLRPKAITDAIDAMFGGMTTALRPQALATRALEVQALNKAADAEIARLVQRQIDAGLDVVTDGEAVQSTGTRGGIPGAADSESRDANRRKASRNPTRWFPQIASAQVRNLGGVTG
jgi:hypothetical protein